MKICSKHLIMASSLMDNVEDLYKEENPIQDDKCSECNIKYAKKYIQI